MTSKVLVPLGGTGSLGREVAKGLVSAEGFALKKALVRDPDSDKASILKTLGWTVEKVPPFDDPKQLSSALADAHTIVSTLSGNDLAKIETAVVEATAKTASLFVPSQFGVDFRRWGTFPLLAAKKTVLEAAEKAGLPTLCVFVGYFSDFIFGYLADPTHAKGRIIGDGSARLSFTRRSDIGFVLAKALVDPEYANGGFISIEGDNKSWKESLDILGNVLGKTIEIETLDAQDALKEEKEALAKGLEGDIGAYFQSFVLHLLGEPTRGSTGVDVSSEAKTYDLKLETLEETLKIVCGS